MYMLKKYTLMAIPNIVQFRIILIHFQVEWIIGYHGYSHSTSPHCPGPFSHLNGPSDEGFKGGNPPDAADVADAVASPAAASAGAGGGAGSCGGWECVEGWWHHVTPFSWIYSWNSWWCICFILVQIWLIYDIIMDDLIWCHPGDLKVTIWNFEKIDSMTFGTTTSTGNTGFHDGRSSEITLNPPTSSADSPAGIDGADGAEGSDEEAAPTSCQYVGLWSISLLFLHIPFCNHIHILCVYIYIYTCTYGIQLHSIYMCIYNIYYIYIPWEPKPTEILGYRFGPGLVRVSSG